MSGVPLPSIPTSPAPAVTPATGSINYTVKKGDTVLFTTYSGTEIKIDGETFIIMTEEDILGIID